MNSRANDTRLKYLAAIKGGAGFPHEEQDLKGQELPFYKVGALDQADPEGVLSLPDHTISRATAARLGAHVFRPDTVVFAKVGAALLLNRFRLLGSDACIDNNMMGLEACPGTLSSRFLFYAMSVKDMSLIVNPGAVPSVNGGQIAEERIWTPDLSVQESIANFLDEQTARIDALIAEKEALLQKLKEQRYSYASQLLTRGLDAAAPLQQTNFPELGAIPAHWEVKRLKFLGEVRSGVAKGKDLGEAEKVSLPYLRVANVQDGYVDLSEVLEIEVAATDSARYLLKAGDVLMNEGGDNDKLGRGTVWQGQIDPCIHQNHVFAVRLTNPGDAEWVAKYTSTDAARTYFFLRSKQSTNLASINQTNVRELPVPMPPAHERVMLLDELNRFTSAVDLLCTHGQAHIARLREYRSSLVSAAVTGQLDLSTFKAAA